jgi:hypothetical protein
MIVQQQITDLFKLWSKLYFSRLLLVDQKNEKFVVEFVLNTEDPISKFFLNEIQLLTIKKHPIGSVAWVGYWGTGLAAGLNSQYKRFKIDFIDSSVKDQIDEAKLGLYVEAIKELIRRKLQTQ